MIETLNQLRRAHAPRIIHAWHVGPNALGQTWMISCGYDLPDANDYPLSKVCLRPDGYMSEDSLFMDWYEVHLVSGLHFRGTPPLQLLQIRLRHEATGPMGRLSAHVSARVDWAMSSNPYKQDYYKFFFQDEADAVDAKIMLDNIQR